MRCTGIDERRLNTVKKHFGKFGIALVAALLMLLTCALCASAAGTATVVYLNGEDGDDSNDGHDSTTAVKMLNKAYSLLDPEKDGTIVLCGPFTQDGHFARSHSAKSITITSVYGGVDYRKTNNAVYKVSGNRFGLADDTTFENMTFESTGSSFLLVAQHHNLTIGEGVTMNNFVGTNDSKAFWIVGGCQWGFGGGPTSTTYTTDALKALMQKPTNVTVLSGSNMIVVGGPRGNVGAEANRITGGDIHVTIGGSAQVTKLDAAGSSSRYTDVGNILIEVIGGNVANLYGARSNNMTAKSFTLLWTDGVVSNFKMMPSGTAEKPVGLSMADGGAVKLEATEAVQNDTKSGYATIAAVTAFTEKVTHEHVFDYENGKVLTPATCVAEGKVLYTCKTCSTTEEGTLGKTDHAYGDWETTTPADLGVPGVKTRTCAYCDATETDTIPAIKAKLVLGENSLSAQTDKTGAGTIRMIATLVTTEDANVTNYGIFVAKTDAIGTAVKIDYTETTSTETAFVLDLTEIPQDELGTAIYAWAFVKVDDELITLSILNGQSVDDILPEKEA